jgi:hypothetical protein
MKASVRIVSFARHRLQSELTLSGEILYSGVSTLRQGRAYLLGHNPGGDANDPTLPTVARSLDELPAKRINSYLDTTWSRQHAVGQAPLQRRVVWLLESPGLRPREVAASNLIFVRSRDAAGSQFRKYAELCWPVHEEIIDVVRPQLVIAFGNSAHSPFGFPRLRIRLQWKIYSVPCASSGRMRRCTASIPRVSVASVAHRARIW